MKIQIKPRFSGKILFELEKDNNTIKTTLETGISTGADLRNAYLGGADLGGAYLGGAYLGGAYLGGAYLGGAYLGGADLRNAYLGGAYLGGADLGGAYLGGAYLGGAYLGGADLEGAYLGGAYLGGAYLGGAYLENIKTPAINDHQFTSEILWRAAKTEAQKDFAARIRLETNQCWSFFLELGKKKKIITWAKKTLSKWEEYKIKIKEIQGE